LHLTKVNATGRRLIPINDPRRASDEKKGTTRWRRMMLLDSPACPLTPNEVYDAGYWRERARFARDMATGPTGQAERMDLLKAADAYERLAHYADGVAQSMTDAQTRLS